MKSNFKGISFEPQHLEQKKVKALNYISQTCFYCNNKTKRYAIEYDKIASYYIHLCIHLNNIVLNMHYNSLSLSLTLPESDKNDYIPDLKCAHSYFNIDDGVDKCIKRKFQTHICIHTFRSNAICFVVSQYVLYFYWIPICVLCSLSDRHVRIDAWLKYSVFVFTAGNCVPSTHTHICNIILNWWWI